MMEDSTLHHVYDTPWALPCAVLARSCEESILRSLGVADSELGSDARESRLELDPSALTRSDGWLRHGPHRGPGGGGGGGGGAAAGSPRGGGGGSVGTLTYIPQNDPHDALIILNIHNCPLAQAPISQGPT